MGIESMVTFRLRCDGPECTNTEEFLTEEYRVYQGRVMATVGTRLPDGWGSELFGPQTYFCPACWACRQAEQQETA